MPSDSTKPLALEAKRFASLHSNPQRDAGTSSPPSAQGSPSVFERLIQKGEEKEQRLTFARWKVQQLELEKEKAEVRRRHSPSRALTSLMNAARSAGAPATRSAVEERLLRYGEVTRQRKEQLEAERIAEEKRANSTVKKLSQKEMEARRNAFLSRNQLWLERRDAQQFEAGKAELEGCTFHPRVNRFSAALDEARKDRGSRSRSTTIMEEPHRKSCTPQRNASFISQCERSSSLGLSSPRTSSCENSDLSPRKWGGVEGSQASNGFSRTVRLYEEGVSRLLHRKSADDTGEEIEENAFKPRINSMSEVWIQYNPLKKRLFEKNFVERQAIYQKVSAEERRQLEEAQKKQWKPHQPSLLVEETAENDESEEKRRSGPSTRKRYEAAVESLIERLYTAKPSKQCSRGDESSPTFQPCVSPGSQMVIEKLKDREKDVVKRLAAPKPARDPPAPADADAGSLEASEGSKVPALREKDAEAFYLRQVAAIKRKDFRVAQEKRREAVQEALECTFHPQITTRKAKPMNAESDAPLPSKVSGLTTFLERQAFARRLQQEKKEREEKLSRGMHMNGPGHTVFTPFHLATEERAALQASEENDRAWAEEVLHHAYAPPPAHPRTYRDGKVFKESPENSTNGLSSECYVPRSESPMIVDVIEAPRPTLSLFAVNEEARN